MPSATSEQTIITSAASTARSRRKIHSVPGIRHWLENVMEQSNGGSQPHIVDPEQDVHTPLTPSLDFLRQFKKSEVFGNFRLSADFSQGSTIRSKPSLDTLTASDKTTDESSSDESFGATSAGCLRLPPRLGQSTKRNRKSRPCLSIEIHPSPYTTRYTIEKGQAQKCGELKEKLRERQAAPAPVLPTIAASPPIQINDIHGFPYQQADTAAVPALIPESPSALNRTLTPPTPSKPSDRDSFSLFPAPSLLTTHGAEHATLPSTSSTSVNKLRLASARMQKKSERMLDAAIAIRTRQDKTGNNTPHIDGRRQQQRAVLAQARRNGQLSMSRAELTALPAIVQSATYANLTTVCAAEVVNAGGKGKKGASHAPKKSVSFKDDESVHSEKSAKSAGSKNSAGSIGGVFKNTRLSFTPVGYVSRKWNAM